jgi:hypothetical protein
LLPQTFQLVFAIRDLVTLEAPTIVHANHSEDYPEDGSVYEPKHVARIFMVAACILEALTDYLSPTNALILTLFNLKY